jgi:hypothetical protein
MRFGTANEDSDSILTGESSFNEVLTFEGGRLRLNAWPPFGGARAHSFRKQFNLIYDFNRLHIRTKDVQFVCLRNNYLSVFLSSPSSAEILHLSVNVCESSYLSNFENSFEFISSFETVNGFF